MIRRVCVSLFLFLLTAVAHGQVVKVQNSEFEVGTSDPVGWALTGDGEWPAAGQDGSRAIAATGDGQSTSYWRSAPLPLVPNAVYEISFLARSNSRGGGTPITGPVFSNVDLRAIGPEWTSYSSIFAAPSEVRPDEAWLRFGQWHHEGTVTYDNVQITRVEPLHSRVEDLLLGEGEEVSGNAYVFRAPIHTTSRNHSRPLARLQCGFNSDRLVFGAGSELVYRHQLGDRQQLNAALEINVGYHVSGQLDVSVSDDGDNWRPVGTQDTLGIATYRVPSDLLPAEQIWVRLQSLTDQQLGADSDPGSFQVHDYIYRAQFSGEPLVADGSTRYASVLATDPAAEVGLADVGQALPGRTDTVVLNMVNATDSDLAVHGTVTFRGADVEPTPPVDMQMMVPPGSIARYGCPTGSRGPATCRWPSSLPAMQPSRPTCLSMCPVCMPATMVRSCPNRVTTWVCGGRVQVGKWLVSEDCLIRVVER